MKHFFSLLLALLCLSATAQNQSRILCGNELLENNTEQRVPGYKAAVKAAFAQAKGHQAQRSGQATYTIPVIFHVVYKAPAENLDDSIIMSELEVLNNDYRRLNADTVNTISYFDSVAADAHIQFVLHDIVRVQTANDFTLDLFTGLPDSLIKFSSAGGDDAVDPDHYLNIWIINLQASVFGQLLGYSYPPANLANWPAGQAAPLQAYDGVVLDYRTVGANNPNPLNFSGQNLIIRGRTATHEIGHFLGLRHIWGDGSTFGANDCLQSDGIDDTPFANTQSSFNCATSRNTCNTVEAYYGDDAPDMVQNYMDYSAETCMNLFTKGQAALMQGTLETARPTLATKSFPTGITSVAGDNGIAVYPNPTSGIVYVQYTESANPFSSIQVYNMLGEISTINTTVASGAVKLDMSALPAGVYILDIVKAGQHTVKRVVMSK